jgi:teichuronic acid biosynthesis glycosyltransferase TuaC
VHPPQSLKVLFVTTSYPAHDEDPSGHFVRAEARALARRGHEVHVVAPLGLVTDRLERDPTSPSLFVHRAGGGSLFGWPGVATRVRTNPLRLAFALPFGVAVRKRIASIGRVDRAIGHWLVPSGVPLLLDHPAPLEVVAHGADVRLLCALTGHMRAAVITALLKRGARFRFAARASLETLGRALPPQLETRLVHAAYVEPAAIELPDVTRRVKEIRASMREALRGFVVAAGRFVEPKRFDLAIEAAASAGVPIVMVGDGPARPELEHVARETRAQVTFTGLCSRSETLAWIAASSVLVHASQAEAAPTVVREARALGVPVVAAESGDLAAWARMDPGIVLVNASRHSMAAAIRATVDGRVSAARQSVPYEFR